MPHVCHKTCRTPVPHMSVTKHVARLCLKCLYQNMSHACASHVCKKHVHLRRSYTTVKHNSLSMKAASVYDDCLDEIKTHLIALLEKGTPARHKLKTILIKGYHWRYEAIAREAM